MNRISEIDENKFLIFMHIGNTGGATVCDVIENQYKLDNLFDTTSAYKKGQQNLKIELKNILGKKDYKIKCVYGHMLFGLHEIFSQHCTYCMMLREPLEQVLSFYYWRVNHSEDPPCKKFIETYSSLEEYVDDVDNYQTRMILNVFKRKLTKKDLLQAKEIMNNHFSVIGITEMMNESLFLMKHTFNWENTIFNRKLCVTKKRPLKEELPDDLIRKIKKQNEYDYELYNYAKNTLIKKIESLDYKMKVELREFILKNQRINEYMKKNKWELVKFSFIEFLEQNSKMKVLVFGTGNGGKVIYNIIDNYNSKHNYKINIVGFLDNNSEKWDKQLLSKTIFKPSLKIVKDVDYIIIASSWSKEIRRNLLGMGVDEQKIKISY